MAPSGTSSAGAAVPSTPSVTPGFLAEYSGYKLVSVAVAFTVLEVVFVTLRLIARRVGAVKFAFDDALILISLIMCVGINATAIAMVNYAGVGFHEIRIYIEGPLTLVLWAKLIVVESFLYLVVVSLPKLAILWIYIRVFPQPIIRKLCYGIGGFMILHMIVINITAGVACRPMAYFWDKSLNGQCVNIGVLYQWASFPNIVSDVAMLLLPLPPLWKLKLPFHVKLGLIFTFLTASIGLISSCLRFAEFSTTNPFADGTWASVSLMIWTIVEPGSYLIAACLPTLRPLVVKAKEHSQKSFSRPSFKSFSLSGPSKRGSNDSNATGISKTTTVAVSDHSASPTEKYIELHEPVYGDMRRNQV